MPKVQRASSYLGQMAILHRNRGALNFDPRYAYQVDIRSCHLALRGDFGMADGHGAEALQKLLDDGWNYHDNESERLARELEAAAEAG